MSNVVAPPLPHTRASQADSMLADSSICRFEMDADIEPLEWLASRSEREQCYWANRESQQETAATGVLIEVSGDAEDADATPWMKRIATHLCFADERIRFYGGMRFDMHTPPSPEWQPFGSYRFVMPRFEAVRRDEGIPLHPEVADWIKDTCGEMSVPCLF